MSTRRWTATELLDLVLDPDSFESWDTPVDRTGVSESYLAELRAAEEKSGVDESVLTGRGLVRGRPVAVVVNEFRFLAGSIGRAAAERIIAAVRRATAEGIPLLATTASGGTRMQEGTPAFVQMVEISRALMDHRAAGLPYLAYLRHPTTGGVFASWGSLAHVTVAEPEALIGFLGPKVYEGLNGTTFPSGVQTAENLAAHGIVDAVVPAEALPGLVDNALATLVDPPVEPALTSRKPSDVPDEDSAWTHIEATRHPGRAGIRELLRYGGTRTVRLRGTAEGERDSAVIVALTRLDGQPCVVVGQDRSRQSAAHPMGPAALRQARRGMNFAEELGLPLVTVIDTPGAELSQQAEEGAIAGEIARCIATMTAMTVPTLSVLLGQGCGGGALALLPARTVIATGHAWLSPLPPEGASMIVHGDTSHASEMAELHRVRASDLAEAGIVHEIVPERPDDTAEAMAVAVAAACGRHLHHAVHLLTTRAEVRVLVRRGARSCAPSRAFLRRTVRCCGSSRAFLRSGGRDLRDQGLDAGPDLVADRAYGVHALAGRVVELPVLVALAREDRTGVAAAHRDHHVGLPHRVGGEQLRRTGGDVDAVLGHRGDRGRVHLVGRRRAGREDLDPVAGEMLQVARGHLRAPGVVHADEQHGGTVRHGPSPSRGGARGPGRRPAARPRPA